jgi:hypothetical protein
MYKSIENIPEDIYLETLLNELVEEDEEVMSPKDVDNYYEE